MYSREESSNFTTKIDTHTHTHTHTHTPWANTTQDTICAISPDDTVESFDIKSAARRMFRSVHITDATILNTHIRGEIDSESLIWIYTYICCSSALDSLSFPSPVCSLEFPFFFLSRLTSPCLLLDPAELCAYVAILTPILTARLDIFDFQSSTRDADEIRDSPKINSSRVADIL